MQFAKEPIAFEILQYYYYKHLKKFGNSKIISVIPVDWKLATRRPKLSTKDPPKRKPIYKANLQPQVSDT